MLPGCSVLIPMALAATAERAPIPIAEGPPIPPPPMPPCWPGMPPPPMALPPCADPPRDPALRLWAELPNPPAPWEAAATAEAVAAACCAMTSRLRDRSRMQASSMAVVG